jgi:hypothetical protein
MRRTSLMRLMTRVLAAGAATAALVAGSAHALVVRFDPVGVFDFLVADPSFGHSGFPGGPPQIYPLSGFGYVFPNGVDWVDFGLDGETLTFGEGDPAGYQLVSPIPLWTDTLLPSSNATTDNYEVTFEQITSKPPQTLEFTNPATGQEVSVTVSTVGVPEPGAWALMLLGVGVLGADIRRRRRFAVTA